MSAHIQPISELTHRATHALIQELGIVDTIRFLNQFRTGSGNYTVEREQLFEGMSVKDIVSEIKARRNGGAQQVAPADRS
ncbi:MAG: hypothetical protein WAV07_14635 [Candidatus Contendobacter sp.]